MPRIGVLKLSGRGFRERMRRAPQALTLRPTRPVALVRVDRATRQCYSQSHSMPSSCRLPSGLAWRAAVTDFRRPYGELCCHMDQA